LKKDLETVDLGSIKTAAENKGITWTLLATYVLLHGPSDEIINLISNNLVGAWDFIKEKLDKKTFVDKQVVFAKRNLTAEKNIVAQIITKNEEFTSFVPEDSFKPMHSWLIH